jgi:hypothetical protein
MAANAAIGKIGKIDFFACLPSGTYVFLCIYLVLNMGEDSYNLMSQIALLSKSTTTNPSSLLLILFCSYLLGSILRAIPVSFSEALIHRKKSEFPYEDKLKEMITEIQKHSPVSQVNPELLPSVDHEITKSSYNYWKDVICVNTPEAFVHYQEFEARTRYFSGMFLSGVVGVLIGVAALIYTLISYGTAYYLVSLSLILLSAIIASSFGCNLQRIRLQEVNTLAGLYLAYIQSVGKESNANNS